MKKKIMICKVKIKDLIQYAENSIQVERRDQIDSHLSECSECRDFLAFLRKSLMVVEQDKLIRNNPFLYTRIMANLESDDEKTWYYIRKFIPPIVFSILLVAGILGGISLGRLYSGNAADYAGDLKEEISYVDDIRQESIETFLLIVNYEENE
jgi:hypothetical protein